MRIPGVRAPSFRLVKLRKTPKVRRFVWIDFNAHRWLGGKGLRHFLDCRNGVDVDAPLDELPGKAARRHQHDWHARRLQRERNVFILVHDKRTVSRRRPLFQEITDRLLAGITQGGLEKALLLWRTRLRFQLFDAGANDGARPLDGIGIAGDPFGDFFGVWLGTVLRRLGLHAVHDHDAPVGRAQSIEQSGSGKPDQRAGIRHDDGVALVERHRAISHVVPSLESFSTMPIEVSSSRIRSASVKFFATRAALLAWISRSMSLSEGSGLTVSPLVPPRRTSANAERAKFASFPEKPISPRPARKPA